jgi:hypothetical protein
VALLFLRVMTRHCDYPERLKMKILEFCLTTRKLDQSSVRLLVPNQIEGDFQVLTKKI